MNLGHAHKTRFWFLSGVFSKFSDEHPRTFIGEYPRFYLINLTVRYSQTSGKKVFILLQLILDILFIKENNNSLRGAVKTRPHTKTIDINNKRKNSRL